MSLLPPVEGHHVRGNVALIPGQAHTSGGPHVSFAQASIVIPLVRHAFCTYHRPLALTELPHADHTHPEHAYTTLYSCEARPLPEQNQ